MSFYFALAYLVVEYMRPQSMYAGLESLPLGLITIVGCLFSFILERRERYNYNFLSLLVSAYLFWFFISFLFAFDRDLASPALIDFCKWVVIYFLLINTLNDRRKLYIFTIVFLFLNFKYAQFAARIWVANGFYSDPRGLNAGGGAGAGWFSNSNDLGVALNSVFGISYYMIQADAKKIGSWFRMQWFHLINTVSLAIAIVATSSRGAMLGFMVVCLTLWGKGRRKVVGFAIVVVVIMFGIALIPDDNWSRFQKMGAEDDGSSQSRLALWGAGMRMANEYFITGVGPNNFIYVNTTRYFSEHKEVQHNVFIQAVSELGYPGLLLFVGMMLYCFNNQRKTRGLLRAKRIDDRFLYGLSHGLDICLVGFAANGFFITVLYYPFFWMLLVLSVSLFDVVRQLGQDSERPTAVGSLASSV